MKNFKLIKLLALFVVLITSINTAWGHEREYDGTEKLYFKNFTPSGWGATWITSSYPHCWVHLYNSTNSTTEDVLLTLHSGTANANGAIYECTPPKGKYTNIILVRTNSSSSISWQDCKNNMQSQDIYVGEDDSKNMIDNLSPCSWGTNYGGWTKYGSTAALVGDFNNWNPNAGMFGDWNDNKGKVYVNLTAGETYEFRILVGETYWGLNSSSTITSSITSWWLLKSGEGNLSITADETGEYVFQWNKNTNYFGVYYPKARLTANKVYYFDASASTTDYWNQASFSSDFYFRYYDSEGNVNDGQMCLAANAIGSKEGGDGPVYYSTAPDNNLIGSIVIDRYNAAGSSKWNTSGAAHGYNRSSSAENCAYITEATSWGPALGWKTYCPPMSSATLSDNSTTVISWTSGDGTSGSPYLVPSTGTIKVSADATSKVEEDLNMTKKYDFKVNTGSGASSEQDGTGYTFNKGSLSNNTTYEISVEPYNYYNGTPGAKYTEATHIWYKALDVYTVNHSLTNMTTASGRTGAAAAAYGIAYTATFNQVTGYNRPASVTVMRGSTNITANCIWNQSTGELTIPAEQVSGNITITVAGEAQVYNITYRDKDNAEFTGTQAGAPTTHTYGSPTDLIMPTREHYEFAGWFTASNCASGQIGNTTAAQLGATAFTGDITLYAKWTEITHTVSFENDGNGTTTPNSDQTAGEVTGVAISVTPATGYEFDTWAITSGSGSFASAATTASNTFYPAADATITASFKAKTYTAANNINKNGGDTNGQYTATYDATSIVINTKPTKAGFDVEGYYINPETSIPIADADGNLVSIAQILEPATAYVSDHKWIYDNTDLVIYPKWTEKTYTITLNKNTPVGTSGTAGTTSFTAKYNTNTYGTISSLPTAVGYTFAGYYTDDATPVLIVKADKSLNTGTAYINGSGSWIHAGDVQLYAHWTANKYEITLNDRGATTASSTTTTLKATYDSDVLTASITAPRKWGNVFGGWVANSDGTGDVIIDTDGNLVEDEVDGYIDEDGKWIHDGDVNLYAKWTPEDHLYWIPGNTSSQVGNVSGAVEFTSAGDGKYYVTIDTDEDDVFHLGDGVNAAGPASPTNTDHTEFTLATSACGLSTNSYWFKQTGSKQTIVYVLDINTLQLSFENLVIYKPGDKSGDGHTAYGSVEGFSGTIYGTFEYRMRVDEIGKWNTLYLPFTTTDVQVWDGAYYDIYPCHRSGGTLMQGYYVIRTPKKTEDFPIKEFGEWNDPGSDYSSWVPAASTPYIIQWQMDYFHNKYISFWGNGGDAGVEFGSSFVPGAAPTADDVVNVLGNGTLGTVEVTAAYVLANDYGSGAWLRDEDVKKKSEVGPFECYILANAKTTGSHLVIKRRTGEETPTGWEDVLNSENKAQIVVYTITGLRVTEYNDCSFNEAGRRLSETYNEGIFIMRAGDESVKLMLR